MSAMNTSRSRLAKDALGGTEITASRRPVVFDSAGGSKLVLGVDVPRSSPREYLKSAPDPQSGCASTGLAAQP